MTRIGGAYYELVVKADEFNRGLDAARTKATTTAATIGEKLNPALDGTAKSSGRAAGAMAATGTAAVGLGEVLGQLIREFTTDRVAEARRFIQSLDTKDVNTAIEDTNKKVAELQEILGASNESFVNQFANYMTGFGEANIKPMLDELESSRTSLAMKAARERDNAPDPEQEAEIRAQERADAQRKRTLERLDEERFQNERARISQIVDEEARIRAQAQQDILETRVDLFDETDPAIIKALEERIKLITAAQDSAIERVQQAKFESISQSVEKWEQAVSRGLEEQRRIVEQLARIADDLQRGFTAFDAGIPLARIEQTLRIMESSVRGIR